MIFIMNFYESNAEFYDAVSVEAWEVLGPALTAALAGVRPEAGPIVDVGAGTGLATAVIAAAVPAARIVAVEPSAALRPALMARVTTVPGLRERVTILPNAIADAALPDRLGGVVALNMLGHLDPAQRTDLWRLLADRLALDAPAVIGLQPPERPERVPPSHVARTRVGDRWYEGWGEAVPKDEQRVVWRMTWRVVEDDRVVDERTAESDWWTVSQAEVLAELAAAGLTGTPAEAGLIRCMRKDAR
jgi:SAM-dependent methyltransferase